MWNVKVNGKFVSVLIHHAMKTYGNVKIRLHTVFNLGIKQWWVVSFMLWLLYTWYPLERMLGEPQSWSACNAEEKKSLSVPGIEPLVIQPAASQFINFLILSHCSWNMSESSVKDMFPVCATGKVQEIFWFQPAIRCAITYWDTDTGILTVKSVHTRGPITWYN
jgi:hypothetical protein